MKGFFVSGGINSPSASQKDAWAAYCGGKVVKLNLDGSGEVVWVDKKIPDYIDKDKKIGTVFKAGSIKGFEYIVCSTTEVFKFDCRNMNLLASVSHPLFNDVHHALEVEDGTLLVVSTGLDAVINITWAGKVINTWSVDAERKYMLSDGVDYRNVESTKPHKHHVNYVFMVENEIFSTRFKDQDAVCLTNDSIDRFHVPYGNIHDGVVKDGHVWFTTTNGWVCSYEIATRAEKLALNLNDLYEQTRPLGWCRSLCIVDDENLLVGFSRLRKTKFKENVRWAAGKIFSTKELPLPTRIAKINFVHKKLVSEINLEEEYGMNAIFSIVEF